MKRTLIAPGVHLFCDPAEKFNRCRISLHFAFPSKRETATAHAVLPLVMERGYADCPDMTLLTKKLARLYGADLTVDARAQGLNHNLCVSVTGIKNRFALAGEDLPAEYAALVTGVAFRPYIVDGVLDPEAVGIEKEMLRHSLEDELNEKRVYCLRQAQREFYAGSPAGIRQEGYLDELDGLTAADVTAAYREMLREANIELIVLGCTEQETENVKNALLTALSAVERDPQPLAGFMAMPRIEPRHLSESFDMVQAKLCMIFTAAHPMNVQHMASYRLAMALFGGSVTSRLFLNVREKMNICYYCSSSLQTYTASMTVNSGVEPANAEKAEAAILKELADLCGGPITDEELEDCRRGLISGMRGIEDSLGGIEAWYYVAVLRGGLITTPEEERAALEAVTKDDVRAVLNQFSLSVSYLLTTTGEGSEE